MSEVLRASLETTKLTFLLFSAQVNEFKFAKNGGRRREKGRVGEEEAERRREKRRREKAEAEENGEGVFNDFGSSFVFE